MITECRKDRIIEAVECYLEQNDKLAFQIDGPWGIGKTFYIQNKLLTFLNEKKYAAIYFSLYGYDDIDKIKKDLSIEIMQKQYAILPTSKFKKYRTKYGKIKALSEFDKKIKFLFQAAELGFSVYQDSMYDQNELPLVFLIDDLERVSDKIDIRDLLGFIQNELLERLSSKVIIISNESVLMDVVNDSSKNDNDYYSNNNSYFNMKEKIIGKTIEFKIDMLTIKEILESHGNEFFEKYSDWIISVLSLFESTNYGKSINLRTLQCVLEDFSYLTQRLSRNIGLLENNQKTKIKKSLFLNIFVITNEIKVGRLFKNELNGLQRICKTRNFLYIPLKKQEKRKVELIIDRYHKTNNSNFNDYIFYHQSINQYIFTGVYEENNYVTEWQNTFLLNDDIKELENFEKLTDYDFKIKQNQILNFQKLNSLPFETILNLACLFKFFEQHDLLMLEDNNYMGIIYPIAASKCRELDFVINKSFSFAYENFAKQYPREYEDLVKLNKNGINDKKELIKLLDEQYFSLTDSTRFFKLLVNCPDIVEQYIYSEPSKASDLAFKIKRYKNEVVFDLQSELQFAQRFKEKLLNDLQTKNLGKVVKFQIKNRLILSIDETISEFKNNLVEDF
ncbi:P-loop NTPase fold protein [Enterococcus columbae]|uniref:KAP NTPase domain-containing protein n=1 Tax=Enterococcus columbae DSM 7374 = ATCC 51263 TaxID=1121865 RepID=S1MU41_9ENTE|nr:P-loop NTPase fold protein [Enterococcus columbae]EOT40429.1 hypothetical protein OMW_01291 [Enterococcus columbae DSM 7374 = ATCC 51263]EOW80205.1 hypothetical protein I568_01905 [Enterococcus columbae DSM 7374 = ATCC 51263]OJG21827.1 hypothetical protein RR47_GL001153 [Enterococcus columbae DSM 7374 = ATCC 51263]